MAKKMLRLMMDIGPCLKKSKELSSLLGFFNGIPDIVADKIEGLLSGSTLEIVELSSGPAPGTNDYVIRFGIVGELDRILATLRTLKLDNETISHD